jgi:hypothetical protein
VTVGLVVGAFVGTGVGGTGGVGALEVVGAGVGFIVGVRDGAGDVVGLSDGAKKKDMGSLMRSTAHHMMPRRHFDSANCHLALNDLLLSNDVKYSPPPEIISIDIVCSL